MTADKTPDSDRLIAWVDVETTGLNEQAGSILEVGIILTDNALNEVAEWSRVVFFRDCVDPEIAAMHGPDGSGLLARPMFRPWPSFMFSFVEGSSNAPPDRGDVADEAIKWLCSHCGDVAPLWGGRNTHFDRRWLRHHMRTLHDAIHHRNVDETTARILLESWAGITIPKDPAAGTKHRVLPDLRETLRVMREVRKAFGRLRS